MKKSTISLSLVITGLSGATTYFALENRHLNELLRKQSDLIKSQRDLIVEDKNLIEKQKTLINEQIDVIAKQRDVITNQKNTIEQMTRSRASEPIRLKSVERVSDEKIYQYDSDFNVVNSYPTTILAAEAVGVQATNISAVIVGKHVSSAGYFWSRGRHPLETFPEKWKQRADEIKKQTREEITD